MIRGVHTMFYSSEAEELRAFLRDKLGFDRFTDVGGGWLIFDIPEADMGVHPSHSPDGSEQFGESGHMDISFYCDDIEATVADLKEKGVEFTRPIEDAGFGFVTRLRAPGDFTIQLYQPKYDK